MPWLKPPLLWYEVAVAVLACWCIHRLRRRTGSVWSATKDWVSYIAIAVGIVLIAAVAALANVDFDNVMQVATPLATAAFVFGFAINAFRFQVKTHRLWITLCGLAVAHFAFFYLVLTTDWRGNPLLIAIVGIPELFIVLIILTVSFRAHPQP